MKGLPAGHRRKAIIYLLFGVFLLLLACSCGPANTGPGSEDQVQQSAGGVVGRAGPALPGEKNLPLTPTLPEKDRDPKPGKFFPPSSSTFKDPPGNAHGRGMPSVVVSF